MTETNCWCCMVGVLFWEWSSK